MNDNPFERHPDNVPYIVFKDELARQERHIKRLWIALIVVIALFFASQVGWLIYESQYELVDETVTVDAKDGIANYVGNNGDIYNGEDSFKAYSKTQEKR